MFDWSSVNAAFYLNAIKESSYPGVFVDRISPYLNPSISLLDIGCGPGAFSLSLAPLVKKVYALDEDARALKHLTKEQQKIGLKNIECIRGAWPGEYQPHIDVIVSAHSGPDVLASKKSLQLMLKITSGHVFLITPAERYRAPFYSTILFQQEGVPMKEHAATYSDSEKVLREMGVDYRLQLVKYDFGQPVSDTREGVEFLSLHLPFSKKLLQKHVQAIAEPREKYIWLPNPRCSALIVFKGQNNR